MLMNFDVSLIFYVVNFSLAALLMWWGMARRSNFIISLSLILPIVISSVRFNVGTDYNSYVLIFKELSLVPLDQYFFQIFPKIEIGFYFLVKLSSWVTGGPFFMFLVSSALVVLFFFFGLKKYNLKNTPLIYLLYLLIIFPTTFNGIRQAIAAAICFFAMTFIISKKPGRYLLWIIIASLFHISALFLTPLYLVNLIIKNNSKDSLLKTLLIFGGLIGALLVLLPYMFELLSSLPIFETYVQYLVPVDDGVNSSFYSKFAIIAVAVLAMKWLVSKNEKSKYLYFIIFTLFEVMISTVGFSATIDRMALYFSFFSIFLIVKFIDIFKDTMGKILMYSLIITYGFAYFYIAYYLNNYGDVMPYQILY